MKARIWHNPKCSTSRKTLDLLKAEGLEVEVIEYLKAPPSAKQLGQLYARAGLSPAEGLRRKEKLAQEMELLDPGASDEAILQAMSENPILIERPLVETAKGVTLARPVERVREIL